MPLIFLAVLGYFLRRTKLIGKDFVGSLNTYIFYVALPVLIFITIANLDDFSMMNWNILLFSIALVIVVTIIAAIVAAFLNTPKGYRPVIVQAFYRGNFMLIGIPLALRLGGAEAIGILALLNAFIVPLTNTLSIVVFKVYNTNGDKQESMVREVFISSIKNPLMIGILIGVLGMLPGSPWPWIRDAIVVVPDTLDFIAVTATPMALIAIGAQFEMRRVKVLAMPIIVGVVGRLFAVPVLVFGVAMVLSRWIVFDGFWVPLIAIFASPIAVSSVAVTKGLGGDDELASQLVLWSTAIAVISLFGIIVVLRLFGYL